MIPSLIQNQLQEIYDLDCSHQVDDYLITDHQLADFLESNPASRQTEEKLLVLEERNCLSISLYLAEELLTYLEHNNPFENLNSDNINGYCTVLEGVSHFMYLTWNAGFERPVSQLELELQAEVDKFVSIIHLARQQGITVQWQAISQHLFVNCSFDPLLNPHELARYQTASNHAYSFCNQLQVRHEKTVQSKAVRKELLGRELRRFYRKRHLEKLFHCNMNRAISRP